MQGLQGNYVHCGVQKIVSGMAHGKQRKSMVFINSRIHFKIARICIATKFKFDV